MGVLAYYYGPWTWTSTRVTVKDGNRMMIDGKARKQKKINIICTARSCVNDKNNYRSSRDNNVEYKTLGLLAIGCQCAKYLDRHLNCCLVMGDLDRLIEVRCFTETSLYGLCLNHIRKFSHILIVRAMNRMSSVPHTFMCVSGVKFKCPWKKCFSSHRRNTRVASDECRELLKNHWHTIGWSQKRLT